jgi:hypothetical protein
MKKSFSFQIGENRISSLFDNEKRTPNGDIEMGILLANASSKTIHYDSIINNQDPLPHVLPAPPQNRIIIWINNYKIEFINVSLSVFLHVCIMIIFEIYFYFNYVIFIEKEAFLDKINDYFDELTKYNTQVIAYNFIEIQNEMDTIYENYRMAVTRQEKELHHLMIVACKIGSGFWSVFFLLWVIGILHFKEIKWKTILVENIVMLVLLGLFEYLFFMNIIMNYNPISDAELEYIVAKKAYSLAYNNTEMAII